MTEGLRSDVLEAGGIDGAQMADLYFDILSDRRRRTVLSLLAAHDRRLTLSDLTKGVAVREHGTSLLEIPEESVTHIHASLHHVHVPKLADAAVVEYDQKRNLVEPTERVAQLMALLDAVSDLGPNTRR